MKRNRSFPGWFGYFLAISVGGCLKAFLLAVLLAQAVPSLDAQKLPFASASIRDGMVDSVVFAMLQDSRGFLWIGTRTGLNRFDGAQFVTFTTRDGLSHNVIRDICETSDGVLWFATENGLSRLEDGKFSTFGVEIGFPDKSLRSIAAADDGSLWIGTYGGGLVHFRDAQGEVFTTDDGLPHNKVRALLTSRDGSLWIGTFGGGVARRHEGRFSIYSEGLGDREIRTLWEDDQGRLWVGTRRGAYMLVGETFEVVQPDSPLASQTVNVIMGDRRGRVWFGTREGGAFGLDGDHLIRYLMDQGLVDNSVTAIIEDFEGNLWFGTYGGGMCRLGGEKVLNYVATEGFSYANVYAIAEDLNGCIWFGTNGGGVSRLCDGQFKTFTTADGLGHNKVLSAMRDRSGSMWFGTLDGASRFDGRRWRTWGRQEGLAHNLVYDMIEDRQGGLWFGTFGGLTLYADGEFRSFFKDDGLADDRINQVMEGADGTIWLGTAQGLSSYSDGVFSSWTEEDGLAANFVNNVFEDEQGAVWISTSGGLSRLKDGEVTSWTVEDGLSSQNCTVVLPATDQTLWVGTSRGVNLFDGKSFSVIAAREGLVDDLVNRGAGYRDREGNLWFGTGSGVSRFDSTFRPMPLAPPPVHMVGVTVLDEPVWVESSPRLTHEKNWLTFEYVGLSFRRARDVVYRYRLIGSGRPWQETRLREVQFSSLPPGEYVFEVMARIGEGRWSPVPASYSFTIVPPIWQRAWFVGLGLVILMAIGGFRVWELRRRAVVLEDTVRERTVEVRQANEELRWLAHHDRLTDLYNRHYIYEIMPSELSRLSRRRRRADEEGNGGVEDTPCLGLILVDLDNFKKINDNWNHMVGDQVLVAVAGALLDATRESDVVARWGGEEFLILLRDLERKGIEETPPRILRAIRDLQVFLPGGETIGLTCSLGFTHFPDVGDLTRFHWESLVKVADVALLQAKRSGRDRGVGFQWPSCIDSVEGAADVTGDIGRAVEAGRLDRTEFS
ncbi:MAG: diguanylate cyclase [Thermoanaerobaculales bacterium]|nr:diguanylate cyclase [Thermoanaerobaculales bacterium]